MSRPRSGNGPMLEFRDNGPCGTLPGQQYKIRDCPGRSRTVGNYEFMTVTCMHVSKQDAWFDPRETVPVAKAICSAAFSRV